MDEAEEEELVERLTNEVEKTEGALHSMRSKEAILAREVTQH